MKFLKCKLSTIIPITLFFLVLLNSHAYSNQTQAKNPFFNKTNFECSYRNLDPQHSSDPELLIFDMKKKTIIDVSSKDVSFIHEKEFDNNSLIITASNGLVKTFSSIDHTGRFIMIGRGLASNKKFNWAGWCH